MLSNRRFLFYLMIIIVVDGEFNENRNCTPNKLILLSNCSFHYSSQHLTTNENRTLSMIVPYPLNIDEQENLLITILVPRKSLKPLIRINLNMIQCFDKSPLTNWTSLESSSTLQGEFVRTSHINKNMMYLSSGKTYLKNLTTIDCLTKTLYRTDHQQLFQLDLRIESTLNDYCSNDHSCYPRENYQCNQASNRCQCRKPFQSYLIKDQYPICLQAVQTIDQCKMENMRCLEWCYLNSSSTMCLCPKDLSKKKLSSDNRAYCESRTGGICNSLIQCSSNDICLRGICQKRNKKSNSLDIVTISIIASCLVLFIISLILGISIYILRRQRWKKHYHPPIDSVCTKQQKHVSAPTMSDYDNVTYDAFRNNVKLSSSDNNDSSPMTTSDDGSYEPKIVYLGGEQQLTAIFA